MVASLLSRPLGWHRVGTAVVAWFCDGESVCIVGLVARFVCANRVSRVSRVCPGSPGVFEPGPAPDSNVTGKSNLVKFESAKAMILHVCAHVFTCIAALHIHAVRNFAAHGRHRRCTVCASGIDGEQPRLNDISYAATLPKEELAAIRAIGGWRSDRYGEITPRGLSELGRSLELEEADVFADLGSGLGRACLQVVREFGASAIGTELSSTRHKKAVEEASSSLDSAEAAQIRFVCADCADRSLWASPKGGDVGGVLANVSVVWMCSALFGEALMRRIGRRISSSAHVRTVATLRCFPGGLAGFHRRPRPLRLEMSWTIGMCSPEGVGGDDDYGGALVHIYDRHEAHNLDDRSGGWLQQGRARLWRRAVVGLCNPGDGGDGGDAAATSGRACVDTRDVSLGLMHESPAEGPLSVAAFVVKASLDARRGDGLFARVAIQQGSYLFDYTGDVYLESSAAGQAALMSSDYVVGVLNSAGIPFVVDAERITSTSSLARYANHATMASVACNAVVVEQSAHVPRDAADAAQLRADLVHEACASGMALNDEMIEVLAGRLLEAIPPPRLHFFASSAIAAGDEIMWDYGEEYWAGMEQRGRTRI